MAARFQRVQAELGRVEPQNGSKMLNYTPPPLHNMPRYGKRKENAPRHSLKQ